jgi:Xaa-Pro aminopeptidase
MKYFPLLLLTAVIASAQPHGIEQTDFPASEFQERRGRVFDAIGRNAIAIIPGASTADSPQIFRQSNEFYYLTGIESANSYLLLDGRSRRTTVYLQHRNPAWERQVGPIVAAEDVAIVKERTGVDDVHGVEMLARHLAPMQIHHPVPALYVPFSPQEGANGSRDEMLRQIGEAATDPWDGRPSRNGRLLTLLRERFPSFELKDLTPVLDTLRFIKSPREISLIRRASQIAGLALMEAIRSTRPGVYEYQLDAVARYVYLLNGSTYTAYPAIIGGGTNAWFGHYHRNSSVLKDGDLVLMDYAPEYHYYASDITRHWPVNGKFTPDQRAMCNFIYAYREAFLKRIKPGVTPEKVLAGAREEMAAYLKTLTFTRESYRKGAEQALDFAGHLQHTVGMTVHDVGTYRRKEFTPGMVFSVDPMVWIPEENHYIRMEDVIVVTETGIENFTAFLPGKPEEIERMMREPGVLQLRAPTKP